MAKGEVNIISLLLIPSFVYYFFFKQQDTNLLFPLGAKKQITNYYIDLTDVFVNNSEDKLANDGNNIEDISVIALDKKDKTSAKLLNNKIAQVPQGGRVGKYNTKVESETQSVLSK